MTVYVDDMRRRARIGRFPANWSHLFADTSAELAGFAARLELRPSWLQHAGTYREHYDVTDTMRARALELGAVPISYPRGTGELMSARRARLGATGRW